MTVNKITPNSPVNRIPSDLSAVGSQSLRREAALQLQRLFSVAASAGITMTAVSGYRSYAAQSSLYSSYVVAYGQAYAETISARPGYSEHQTGLAMDLGNPNGACGLQACFAGTPSGSYAAANAWKYGFIIRYPDGLSAITGYTYEPWHLRYVGTKVAADMHNRGVRTLEQYLGVASAPRY
ncbi:M15 family metallopeptidase [Micrococcaceae bacterium Sec5.7]